MGEGIASMVKVVAIIIIAIIAGAVVIASSAIDVEAVVVITGLDSLQ